MQKKIYQILFVDGDEGVCETMSERLTSAGYQVISACNLEESLCLAKIGMFDLYLFGQLSPEGSNTKLCCFVRDFDAETPILLYSGLARRAEKASGVGAVSTTLEQAIARLLPANGPKVAGGSQGARPAQPPTRMRRPGSSDSHFRPRSPAPTTWRPARIARIRST